MASGLEEMMKRALIKLSFLLACPAWAQVGFGVKGGFTASTDYLTGASIASESRRYVVGPMLEVALSLGLGIEVDGLYSRLGYRYAASTPIGTFGYRARGNSWELPILLKWKLPVPLVRPYISGGIAGRYIDGVLQTEIPFATTFTEKSGAFGMYGPVVAGGVEVSLGHFHIAPEVRYNRWDLTRFYVNRSQGLFVDASQNQVRILVGLSFR